LSRNCRIGALVSATPPSLARSCSVRRASVGASESSAASAESVASPLVLVDAGLGLTSGSGSNADAGTPRTRASSARRRSSVLRGSRRGAGVAVIVVLGVG
jgi:hypothetical protein